MYSVSVLGTSLMNSVKSWEFLRTYSLSVKPEISGTRAWPILRLYVAQAERMGLKGKFGLWTLGKPYKFPNLVADA